jgi:hypothetical protein
MANNVLVPQSPIQGQVMGGAPAPLPPQLARIPTQEAVMSLLQQKILRRYVVDIEVDSSIIADAQKDQEQRLQFIQAAGQFIAQLLPVAQTQPKMVPYLGKLFEFGVKGFPIARDLISATETMIEDLEQQAQQAEAAKQSQPPPPSPEMLKLQAAQVQAQAEMASSQAQAQANQAKAQADVQAAQLKLQQSQQDHQHAIAKMQLDHQQTLQQAQQAHDLETAKYIQALQLSQQKANLEKYKQLNKKNNIAMQTNDDAIFGNLPDDKLQAQTDQNGQISGGSKGVKKIKFNRDAAGNLVGAEVSREPEPLTEFDPKLDLPIEQATGTFKAP